MQSTSISFYKPLHSLVRILHISLILEIRELDPLKVLKESFLIFITAFNDCRNHFELLVGIKSM